MATEREKLIEAMARGFAKFIGKDWECACIAAKGLDCDCGGAMSEERADRYDDEYSRQDCRDAMSTALTALEATHVVFTKAEHEAALLAERERATAWQPIETAPKDGAGFLAYWPISETQWCIVTCWWKTTGAAGPSWHTVDLFDDDSERLILPTKWQPLPPPPAIRSPAHD